MSQQQQLQEEREAELFRALDECFERGVSRETLRTLVYETGVRWIPHGTNQQMDARTHQVA